MGSCLLAGQLSASSVLMLSSAAGDQSFLPDI